MNTKLHEIFNNLYVSHKFNGNVLIAENNNILLKESFGFSNIEKKIKLNHKTTFELASISKQFTAFAIALLENEGHLSFNDPLEKYIPELKFYKDIKVLHLLTHTSGLPDHEKYLDLEFNKDKIATNIDVINLLVKYRPKVLFKPNEKFEYCNVGYLLLATIIERITDLKYPEYLTNRIFKPLGLQNTFVYQRRYMPQNVKNNAIGYITHSQNNTKVIPDNEIGFEKVFYHDGTIGDAFINSDVEDLYKWSKSLDNAELLTKDKINVIFTPHKLNNGEKIEYGLGWYVGNRDKCGKIAFHDGEWMGFNTFIEKHLDFDRTVIILQNIDDGIMPIPQIRKFICEQEYVFK